jgi:hypothetical protein
MREHDAEIQAVVDDSVAKFVGRRPTSDRFRSDLYAVGAECRDAHAGDWPRRLASAIKSASRLRAAGADGLLQPATWDEIFLQEVCDKLSDMDAGWPE